MARKRSTSTILRRSIRLSDRSKPRHTHSTRWIPADIAEYLKIFADPSDLARLACTCTMWRDHIARLNTFWYRLYMRDFPIGAGWHVSLLQWQLECDASRPTSSTSGRRPAPTSNSTITKKSNSAFIKAMTKVRRFFGRNAKSSLDSTITAPCRSWFRLYGQRQRIGLNWMDYKPVIKEK